MQAITGIAEQTNLLAPNAAIEAARASASAQEISASAQELAGNAEALNQLVAKFKTDVL